MESTTVRRDYRPSGEEPRTGLWPTLKRTLTEFQEDNLSDWAAALTYYGLLSLFPALIAMVSLIGIFGDPKTTTSTLTEIITEIGPSSGANYWAARRIKEKYPQIKNILTLLCDRGEKYFSLMHNS